MNKISRATSFALVFTLFFGPLIRAQTPAPLQLQVRMVAGISATYEAGSLQSTKLAVQVTDQSGVPVPDAAVTFRLPEDGASGLFADGNRSAVIYTNQQGEASVSGIRWGATVGTLSLRITAAKGSAHAGILAPQELIAGAGPATATIMPTRSVPAVITTPPPASKPPAAVVIPAETRAVSNLPPPAPRVNSEVTILTQPEKAKVDPAVRAAITPLPSAAEAKPKEPPAVTISSAPPGHGSGKAKWIVIGLLAAGAVAGVGFAMGGKSSTTAAVPVPGTTIGAPSVSIGHP